MKGNRIIFGWIVLLVGLLCSVKVGATDVSSEQGLRDAINRGDSYIRLISDISLGSTLTITNWKGTLDLNEKTITYDKSSEKVNPRDDIAINLNGDNVNIAIKNGFIVAKAAN